MPEYRLKNGVDRIVQAGLVLERGETVELDEEAAENYPELQRVSGGDEEASE